MKNGWHDGRETNTVTYDPNLIGPDEMIQALRDAGTFSGVKK